MKHLHNKEMLFSVGSVCLAALAAAAAFMPYDPPDMKPREASSAAAEDIEPAGTDTTTTASPTDTTLGTDTTLSAADTTLPPQETTTTQYIDKSVFRGPWFDADGSILWMTEGTKRIAAEGCEYAFSNLLSAISGPKLDSVYEAALREENPTLHTSSTGNKIGQGVQLTLSAQKQIACYDLLSSHGIHGAIVVMAEDGAVEVAASYPSFNHNEEENQTMNKQGYNNQAFFNYPEGSVAKVRSAVVAGYYDILAMEDLGYHSRFEYGNWDYDEHPERYPVTRSLRDAILNSSNYWFGELFYDLGYRKVSKVLDEYFLWQREIDTDFGTVLRQTGDMSSNNDLSRIGFGQRSTASMFYSAMSASAVVTGAFNRPYMVSGTMDAVTEQPLSVISSKETLSAIPEAYRTEAIAGMQAVAADLGLEAEGFTLAAKTGTAQLDTANYDYFLRTAVVLQNDETGETFTALLMVQNPGDFGWEYASDSKEVVQELLELLVA